MYREKERDRGREGVREKEKEKKVWSLNIWGKKLVKFDVAFLQRLKVQIYEEENKIKNVA